MAPKMQRSAPRQQAPPKSIRVQQQARVGMMTAFEALYKRMSTWVQPNLLLCPSFHPPWQYTQGAQGIENSPNDAVLSLLKELVSENFETDFYM